jgi:glyoxylase-like metal-dependent hydrolase (beta-lactamase superfamily II)
MQKKCATNLIFTEASMTKFICQTCGTQYADSTTPPPICKICADDRQYTGWAGQQWTTLDELASGHRVRFEMDGDLMGIGITPAFGIPQRALYLPTDAGNIMLECTSLVTPAAVGKLKERGDVHMIVISHPHFYAAMVEWSEALGGVPILLHEADQSWVQRTSKYITFWKGDEHQLSSSVTLYRCPGHFPGSTVLH